jgi:aryl-alcohol dehydrogenase-like predicted oxidoreductase
MKAAHSSWNAMRFATRHRICAVRSFCRSPRCCSITNRTTPPSCPHDDDDELPAPRTLRAESERAVVRLLGDVDGSLARLGLDHVDLAFCHRPDPETPIEETVYAFHDMIQAGKVLYWGTSEWSAAEIMAAWQIAERHHLHKPVMEQPQYNLLHRERVEDEYARLYRDIGLGTTTWSPLASGLLTGKYANGAPADSRATIKGYEWLAERILEPTGIAKVKKLVPIAAELGCTLAQMSLAWCLRNPHVSTVITGASRPSQVVENLKALDVVEKLTPDVIERIDQATL